MIGVAKTGPAWSIRGLLLAVPLSALLGCSALQVDVDVYKGPLTSQREIQLRQFSTLAMAAKPLLAELRNVSEGYEFTEQEQGYQWRFFAHDYKDEVARFANGALSYYEDLEPLERLKSVDAAALAHQELQSALRVFDVNGASGGDCELATRVTRDTTLRVLVARFLRAGVLEPGVDQSTVCTGQARSTQFSTSSAALGRRSIEKVLEDFCPGHRDVAICREKRPSVSAAYLALAQPDSTLAPVLASAVFANDPVQAERLRERLVSIGTAFRDARDAMLRLWVLSDDLVPRAYGIKGLENRAGGTARFLANTTEPRILACFLTQFPNYPGVDPVVRDELVDKIPKDWSQSSDRERRSEKFRAASESVAVVTKALPAQTAATLGVVHNKLRSLSDAEAMKLRECPHYAVAADYGSELVFASKMYGLARGTAVENEFDQVLRTIVDQLAFLTVPSRYGFDEARPRLGIVTLTQNYVLALTREVTPANRTEVAEARRQLEETLIPFAERVLYVANNAALIKRNTSADQLTRNSALLQAVGNTIIVLADDIRRQSDHDTSLTSRRHSEAVAINRAFAGNAGATYDALLVEITSTAQRLQAEASRLSVQKEKAATRGKAADTDVAALTGLVAARKVQDEDLAHSADEAVKEAARFRAAAVTVVAPKSGTNPFGLADDSGAPADRVGVATMVAGLPKSAKGETVVPAIKTWIAGAIDVDSPGGVTQRLQRLKVAKAFFEDAAITFPSLPDGDPSAAFAEVKRRLAGWMVQREKAALDLSRQVKTASKDATNQKSELARGKAKADAAKASEQSLATSIDAANTSAARLTDALQAIKDVRDSVLARATGADAANPASLKGLLSNELKTRADAAKGTDAAKRYTLALGYVEKTSPAPILSVEANGPGLGVRANGGTARSQVDVLDDLIAQLRQLRLQALANGEPARAKNYEEALKAAFEQRGSMAYLRPTGAYLRNVFAATAVQADPDNVGQRNLLFPRLLLDSKYLDARIGVEKQFWDRVNTVQVGSAGASNYVLVKDDIGNWYLKALASDTNSIIQSAQSLALFNMGKKFDTNLLRRSELQRRADSTETSDTERSQARSDLAKLDENPGAGTGASTAGLSTVQKKYADEYARQTASDVSSLLSVVVNLSDQLVAKWEPLKDTPGIQDKLQAMVAAESEEQKSARTRLEQVGAAAEADRPVEGANAIIDALRAMRRMRDRLTLAIARSDDLIVTQKNEAKSAQDDFNKIKDSAKPEDQAYKDADTRLAKAKDALITATTSRDKAASGARDVFNELISSAASRRIDAVKVAQTAYEFIGEAATAK